MISSVVYLDVPYVEKEKVKKLGAKWDPEERKWYVPKGLSVEDFVQWVEEDEESTGH